MRAKRVLITGAAGYIASQVLPAFQEKYELILMDVRDKDRQGRPVQGIVTVDLIDADRDKYSKHFLGVDAVVHLAHKSGSGRPIDRFFEELDNLKMAYNVYRTAYDTGVRRVVMASSNHAADWYEHALIHRRKMDMVDPHMSPLSDNFYGWAKACYEHMGFLFATGAFTFADSEGVQQHTGKMLERTKKLEVVLIRIGAPREIAFRNYRGDIGNFKRDLGAYASPMDLAQLFSKAVDAPNIDNEYGVPWLVVYGISNNARAFWSLANARKILGYEPEDDSEVKFASEIRKVLELEGCGGRVGPV